MPFFDRDDDYFGHEKSNYSHRGSTEQNQENTHLGAAAEGALHEQACPEHGGASAQASLPHVTYDFERHGREPYEAALQSEPESWSEPSFSQAHETAADMYTPGIIVDQPYMRKRVTEQKDEKTKKMTGRVFSAACVVLFCALFSAAATYGVIEFRISRGDFESESPIAPDFVNVVEIGGTRDNQFGNLTTPITSPSTEIMPEDIYDIAVTQVVGIRTDVHTSASIFGAQDTMSPLSGSGFIISSDGYILTNYHVIEVAHLNRLSINVILGDGSEHDAAVIGFDSNNDVALLRINTMGLSPVIIADSDHIRVGQRVFAVGNPFGELVYTMTDGIVSALDRVVSVERKAINTFQFSAAVNSGNSGGPVYNASGEVIGIVTAKLMRGSVEGIGFAIPINDAIEIARELIEHGYIQGRPLMGISIQTVTSGQAAYYELVAGCRVLSLMPDSAADKAGLVVGDIIIMLGDNAIENKDSLFMALRKYRAGDTEMITVWRDGEEVALNITFDEDMFAGQPHRS